MTGSKPIEGEYRVVQPGDEARPVTVVKEQPAFSFGSALAGAMLGAVVSYFVPELIDRAREAIQGPAEYDLEDEE